MIKRQLGGYAGEEEFWLSCLQDVSLDDTAACL